MLPLHAMNLDPLTPNRSQYVPILPLRQPYPPVPHLNYPSPTLLHELVMLRCSVRPDFLTGLLSHMLVLA
uniref:Uncharacterized protein n=1 Tax=Arundo donax TaxID=35708 RepID=A0A0A9BNX6_ARUDO